jgi:hypothetical protein
VYYLRFLNIITPCGVVQTYWKPFTKKEFLDSLTKNEIDSETDHDLHDIMSLNLWELKIAINNDLLLNEEESDESFWLYFVKPTYRLKLERASEKCRYNEDYKKSLFEKSIC